MSNPFYYLALIPLLVAPTVQQCETDDDDSPPDLTPTEWTDCSDMSRDFWAYDFSVMPPSMKQYPATCRKEGSFMYVYVADDQWDVNVTAEDVEEVLTMMELETPEGSINPYTGIYENNVAVFGNVPDALDDDPKFYLLLMGMDQYTGDDGTVYSFDGYFGDMDQYTDEEIQRQTFGRYHSNELEIIYVNSAIRPVTDPYTIAVVGHEMQHLIAWNYDEAEDTWMSESLAEVAMLVNGYYTDIGWVENYAGWTGYPLVYNGSVNYGACLLWGMYLYEQIGQDFMIPLESEQEDGIVGLDRALRSYGSNETFDALYEDWVVANVVDDSSDGRYGYAFGDVPEIARMDVLGAVGDAYDGETYAYGVDYIDIQLESSSQATLELQTDDGPNYSLGLLIRWEAGVMTDITSLEVAGINNTAQVELVADTSDTYWTLAVSYTNPDAVDAEETMSYGVQLLP